MRRLLPLALLLASLVVSCEERNGREPPPGPESTVREETPDEDWGPELRFFGDLKITPKKRPIRTARIEERKRKVVESTEKSVKAALVVYRAGGFVVDFLREDGVKRRPIWPEPLTATLWVLPKDGKGKAKPVKVRLEPSDKSRRKSDGYAFRFIGKSDAFTAGRVKVLVIDLPEGAGGGRAVFRLPDDYEPY